MAVVMYRKKHVPHKCDFSSVGRDFEAAAGDILACSDCGELWMVEIDYGDQREPIPGGQMTFKRYSVGSRQ